MPLLKKTPIIVSEVNTKAPETEIATEKPALTKHKREAPMTKDDYWRNREERDIEKDQRISRAGMFQAALQSVGILQLNTGNTLDDYIKLVEQAAERGLAFVHRK